MALNSTGVFAVALLCAVTVTLMDCVGGQQTCTATQSAYTSQAYTAYSSQVNYRYYSCGFWGLSRCSSTYYSSQAYTAYRSVLYYYEACCSGYGGTVPNCLAICSLGCDNGGTCDTPELCLCANGWTGQTCTDDVDECILGTYVCDGNATCVNTIGSYSCSCNTGFQGSGTVCADVNECDVDNGGCHHNCHNDIGSYQCSCNDSYLLNSDGHTCEIPPLAPTSLQAANVSSRSAALNWQAPVIDYLNNLTMVSSYQVIATQDQFSIPDVFIDTGENMTSYTLFDVLEEYTFYSCSVKAENTFGLGDESQPVEFRTLQAAPSAPPQNTSGYSESPTVIVITWSPPPPIDINGVLLYYEVQVEEVETGQLWTVSTLEEQLRVDTLHPYYNYNCEVAAFTTGLGPFSDALQVQTLEAAPTAPPQNITVQIINSTLLILSWQPPPFEDTNGDIRQYVVTIRELETSTSSQLLFTSTEASIDQLHPYYMYTFQIAAETVELGPFSSDVTVQLPEDAPSAAPQIPSGYGVDSTTISLTWSPIPDEHRNGIIRYYSIIVNETDTGTISQHNSTSEGIVLSELHPYYTYECQIAGVTNKVGPFSASISIQTPQDVPSGPPLNFSAETTSPWSLSFSWEPPYPEHWNGILLGYVINVTTAYTGATVQLFSGMAASTFSGNGLFDPYTVYECSIAAFTQVGTGPDSTVVTVRTLEYVPTEPLNVIVSRVIGLPTQLYVTWSVPINPNGVIQAYTVYCGETIEDDYEAMLPSFGGSGSNYQSGSGSISESGSTSGIIPVAPEDKLNYTVQVNTLGNASEVYIQELFPFTEYECFVTANTSIGEGNPSLPYSATTDESIPGDAPQTFYVTILNSTSILLAWSQPSIPNGIITSFTITYNLTEYDDVTIVLGNDTNNFTAGNLNEYTFYTFHIHASTRIGPGPSVQSTARTDESYPHSPPLDVQSSGVGQRTATISWQPPIFEDQNGPITLYRLIFSQMEFEVADIIINTTNTSYTETNLEEYNEYTFMVAAATRIGLGPFTPPMSLMTLQSVPSAPPQNASGLAHSPTVIALQWSPPPPIDVNGVLRHYMVQMMETETGRTWSFIAVDTALSIGSLHPYYNYSSQVAAYTIGIGPYTNHYYIRTHESIPTSPPTRPEITAFTSTSANLSWQAPPFEETNGVIREYVILVNEVDTGIMFEVPSNESSTTVQPLHPFYTYVFKVRADTIGPGPYSSESSITLDEEAPSGPPLNVVGQADTSTSLFLSWEPPHFEEQNGIIREYIVTVSEVESGETWSFNATNTMITISSLHPAYTYMCTVAAVTVGSGPTSEPVSVTTLDEAPTSPPLNISVTVQSSRSLYVTWELPSSEDRNGMITRYILNVTSVPDGDTIQLTSNTTQFTYDSLQPYTTYTIAIAAETSAGIGPFSQAATLTTPEDAPTSPPRDVVAVAVDSRTLTLTWNPPPTEDHNGIIREYHIDITETETGEMFRLTSTVTFLAVQSLHPYYTYLCAVSAYTVLEGPYSLDVAIQMPVDVPSASPTVISVVDITSNTAAMMWEPPLPEYQNGAIIGYLINVTLMETEQVYQLYTNDTDLTFDFLQPHDVYTVVIAAETTAGLGPFSTSLLFETKENVPSGPPQDVQGLTTDSRTVLLSWNPPPLEQHNGIIREYHINVTEVDTGREFGMISTITSIYITSLHPYYNYNFSVAAFTVGIGPFSEPLALRMPQDAPASAPRELHGIATTSRSIFLSWEPPKPEDWNGIITGYNISMTEVSTGEANDFFTASNNFTVESLSPHTTYGFFVAAHSIAGTGPSTHLVTVLTPEEGPVAGPTNLTIVSVTATSIHLSWDHPPEDAHQGIIREYRINVTELETERTFREVTPAENTEVVLESLHPYYTYRIVIVAFTVEEGSNYTTITIQTDEDAPSAPPQDLNVTAVDSRSIQLSWSPPPKEHRNGIIQRYLINISTYERPEPLLLYSSINSLTVYNLKPFTTYLCTVAAESIATGPFTEEVEVATPEDAPTAPPGSLNATPVDPNTLLMSWDPPPIKQTHGIVRRYIVNITELTTGDNTIIQTTETETTVTGLHPYYYYSCRVAAETVAVGPWTEGITVQMPEDAPSASPEELTVQEVGAFSFVLRWNTPNSEEQNGLIRRYVVNITEENTMRDFRIETITPELLVQYLHPFYNYTCSVAAVTVAVGPYSPGLTITTKESYPVSPPEDIEAMVISSTSIRLEWTPPAYENQNGVITGYIINITAAETGEKTQWFTEGTNITLNTLIRPHSTYSFEIAAQNSAGRGPFSTPVTVQTPEDAPTAPPVDVAYINLTSTSLILTWKPPSDDHHNGIIRSYIVQGKEETGRLFTLTSVHTQVLVGQLHPYYTYNFTVSAVTTLPGPYSEPLGLQTLEDVPAGFPLGLSAEVVDSRAIILTWNPPSPDQHNGVIRYYLIRITETESQEELEVVANATSEIVSSLHPYYTYQLRVAAVTIGTGPFSQEYAITTPEDGPSGPPQNFSVEVLSSTSISLVWASPIPEDQNGLIRFYNITVLEVNTGNVSNYWREAEHTQIVIYSLHPNYNYECGVAATTISIGPFSSPLTITTLEDAPSKPPSDVLVTIINSTSIQVEWQPPEEPYQNGMIKSYLVTVVHVTTQNNMMVEIGGTEAVLTFLHPSYSYELLVAAVTVESGPFTEALSFTMPEDIPSGPPVNFQVTVQSSTVLNLAWEPPISDDQNGEITGYDINVMMDRTGTTSTYSVEPSITSFTIEELHPYANYSITVSAKTAVGVGPPTVQQNIQTPQDAPSAPPQNVQKTAITSTSASLNWQPPPLDQQNGIITYYMVFLDEHETGLKFTVNTSATEVNLSDLHPFYTYDITVAAVTVEVGASSVVISVKTLEDVPSGPPRNLMPANVTSRSITLTWDPPYPNEWNGIILYYVVDIVEMESGEHRQEVSTNSTSLLVYQLHPYYSYSFNVSAATTIGPGPQSEVFTVRALEEAPVSPPRNFSGHAVNSTHILLSWEPPLEVNQNGLIRSYLICITELQSNFTFTCEESTQTTKLIGSLHPYYLYECLVTAVTIAPGPYTDPLVIRTQEDVPSGPPQNISVSAINITAIHIMWNPPLPEVQNGIILNYLIDVTEIDTAEYHQFTSDGTSLSLANLHPFYTYKFTIAAVTIGAGPKSLEESITTPEDIPSGPPQELTGVPLGATSIQITWQPPLPEEQNGIIREYRITVTGVENGQILDYRKDGSDSVLIVSSLHPYYNYQCSVSAVTLGDGPAAYVVVTTDERVPTDAPHNISITALDTTVAMMQWDPPPFEHHNGIIQAYTIVMIELDTGTVIEREAETSPSLFDNLHPFNRYRFVIAARTIGLGPFSGPVTLQMPEARPLAPVENVAVGVESAMSVKVSWLPPDPQTWNGLILNYTVLYELVGPVNDDSIPSGVRHSGAEALPSPQQPLFNSPDPRVVTQPLHREILVINGLYEYHAYMFTVYMANSAGRSELTTPIIQELPGAEPSGAPTTIQIKILSSSSVEVLWEPPDYLDQNGVITGYVVTITHVVTDKVLNYSASLPVLLIEGLQKYGKYYLQVAAQSEDGLGPYSIPIEFRTLEDIPGPPHNVSMRLVNDTTVLVSWQSPKEPNGVITEYEVYYAGFVDNNGSSYMDLAELLGDGPYTVIVANTSGSDGKAQIVITDLVPGLKYEFKVRAITAIGNGSYSTGVDPNGDAFIQIPDGSDGTTNESSDAGPSVVVVAAAFFAVFGWLTALVLITAIIWKCYRKRRSKKYSVQEAMQMTPMSNSGATNEYQSVEQCFSKSALYEESSLDPDYEELPGFEAPTLESSIRKEDTD